MDDMANDLRYAFRTLWNARIAAVTTVLTLGIGIGLLTAVFSIINAAVLRPLPYGDSNRLVAIGEDHPRESFRHSLVSPGAFEAIRDRARSFDAVSAYESEGANVVLGAGQTANRLSGARVSLDLFAVLRVQPFRGRLFTADEVADGSNVLLVSHELWNTRLGSNERVVGSTVRVDGVPHTVIGVMAPTFNFPSREHFWRPLVLRPDTRDWSDRSLSVVARLRDGSSVASARAEVATLGSAFARANPATQDGWSFAVRPDAIERRSIPGPVQWMILLAGIFLMLIACGPDFRTLFLPWRRISKRFSKTSSASRSAVSTSSSRTSSGS